MYSLSCRNHIAGIQLVRPMYHLCPSDEDAYYCPSEYLPGDDIIVLPFITPIDPVTAFAPVWLPPGEWFVFQTGREYGGGWHAGHVPPFTTPPAPLTSSTSSSSLSLSRTRPPSRDARRRPRAVRHSRLHSRRL
jgi:hypothetical protein